MKTVGVIPARWGSTRLPGKSLIPICGKPLIQWVVEGARRAETLSELLVATDDQRIVDAVAPLGVDAVMTAADHPSGTDRVAEAIAGRGADVIVNIQGDEPLIDPGLIDKLITTMTADACWDMATAAVPIENPDDVVSPSVVKVIWDAQHRALYFSRSVIPFVRDPGTSAPVQYWRHLGIYAYRAPFLARLVATEPTDLEMAEKLEQLRALHLGGRIAVLETDDLGIGVDTAEDVKYVEQLLRKLHGM